MRLDDRAYEFLRDLGIDADHILKHARLAPLLGHGRVEFRPEDLPQGHIFRHLFPKIAEPHHKEFEGVFVLPVCGPRLIIAAWSDGEPAVAGHGIDLTLHGESEDGPFRLSAPELILVQSERKPRPFAICRLVNQAVDIEYASSKSISRAEVLINNFDFDYGNVRDINPLQVSTHSPSIRFNMGKHEVRFDWREEHDQLSRLTRLGLISTASLTRFSIDGLDDLMEAAIDELVGNIAMLCSVVAQQHTGASLVSYFDAHGHLIKRSIGDPITSRSHDDYLIEYLQFEDGLPGVFGQCFDRFCELRKVDHWRRLISLMASINDATYLEQKFATLTSCIESFLAASLIDVGELKPEDCKGINIDDLLAAANKKFGWKIQKKVWGRKRLRELRNAVHHGDVMGECDANLWHELAKWRLFLMRRFMISLGFTGRVRSPDQGWRSMSAVDDFSKERNHFNFS